MNFTYETQGAITFLVCELEPADTLDTLALGMITTNHIKGLAPVIYTEMNGQRYLKYNISAKVTADRFFGGNINKQRLVTAFQNILNAVCSADEYMLDPSCFSLVPEHVFLNVSNCEVSLICIPVAIDSDVNATASTFFSNMIDICVFAPNENRNYVDQIENALSAADMFNLYNFRDIINNLDQAPAASFNPSMNNAGFAAMQFGAQQNIASPVSAYDSTITINEAPQLNNPSYGNFGGIPTPAVTPAAPVVTQPVTPQSPVVQQMPNVVPQPVSSFPVNPVHQTPAPQPVIPQAPMSPAGIGQTPAPQQPSIPIPPAKNQGFAIPGQNSAKVEEPVSKKKNKKNKKENQPEAEPQNGEKKMTLLGLLTKYNKENAALYKAQKEAEKQTKAENAEKEKQAKQAAKTVKAVNIVPGPGVPAPVTPPVQTNPVPGMMGMGGIGNGGIQPVPVQNSFNETTVLSAFSGGETTVLSANTISEPALFRIKTGERVVINKPVFRIGKEKSYVDYFIGDNTAISRSHCNIHTENGEYFVEDTNSTNHTYVNGAIITGNTKVKITNGDKIRLANEDFTFSV